MHQTESRRVSTLSCCLLVLGTLTSGCAMTPSATVEVYSNLGQDLVVRVTTGATAVDFSLPADDIGFVFSNPVGPSDLSVSYLDPKTCEVLGSLRIVSRNVRIGLNAYANHPSPSVETFQDDAGSSPTALLPTTTMCAGLPAA
jgi:hypothetical protein